MPFKKSLLAAACLAVFTSSFVVAAPAASNTGAPPAEAFFAPAEFGGAVLSPDGNNVALLMRGPEGNMALGTMPAEGGPVRMLAGIRGMDLTDIHWVNNHRLVYSAIRPDTVGDERSLGPGLYAIDIDGSKRIQLVAHDWQGNGRGTTLPPNTRYFGSVRDPKSNDVYAVRYDSFREDFDGYTLFRLNTENGDLTRVDMPLKIRGVVTDPAGVPRAAIQRKDGRNHLLYNDPATGAWRELLSYDVNSSDFVSPELVTRSGELYVLAYGGRDTLGMYHIDVHTGKLDAEPVIGLKHYDFEGALQLAPDHENLLGVRYETSEQITTWFDDGMKQIQKRVDAALPSTINDVYPARDALADTMIVYSYSDTEPGFWHLYHPGSGKLVALGTRRPAIDPLQMGSTTFVHFKAKDGREIPAYLTVPRGGAKKLPMVVLVHGGPWVRGAHLGWDPQVQFLATRGYAVLQPEFRGSEGFGLDHFKAGWKQWGQAMQDDVADGARWAIAQGVADPKRICIAGASYGGYATLMGLARNPDLFRCGVDWVGVTDINLLYDLRFTSTSQDAKRYGLPLLIGDPVKDAAMLKANSPLENAARITQPLLMAYGGKDRTVPLKHGQEFYDAVKQTNPHVEWIEYPDEGHGWRYEHTSIDFWTRVAKFLDANIGKPD